MANSKKKILIVEDEKALLFALQEKFEGEGFLVLTAENGEEGLDVATKTNPDVILIDIILPRMNGIIMAKKIKDAGITSSMIFLTNLDDAEHVVEAFDATKTSDYLVKADWSINEVVKRVRERLDLK